jgi:5-methylcytosine-specific restriction endonuclease McrA
VRLYEYCTKQLGFSADVAYKRVKVAQAAAAHPQILEHLETGELSLSSVLVIAPHLDDLDDSEGFDLVEAARCKSKREVERMIAARVPDAAPPRGGELRLQMSERFEALLQEARDLEGVHDAAAILEKALEKFVEGRQKQRFAQTDRPRARALEVTTDAIPARVKREVYLRDGGVCSFVSESQLGTRQCESTYQLEFDHVIPRALGGESTVENLRLLCRNHNMRAAEQILGKHCVQEALARARLAREAGRSGALGAGP